MRIKVEVFYDDKDCVTKRDIELFMDIVVSLIARYKPFKAFNDYGFARLAILGSKIKRSFTWRKFSKKELLASYELKSEIPFGKQKK